jgi:hypothetical protein
MGVTAINGVLYVVGGFTCCGKVATLEAYDPASDTWTTKASMPTATYGFGVAAINGRPLSLHQSVESPRV